MAMFSVGEWQGWDCLWLRVPGRRQGEEGLACRPVASGAHCPPQLCGAAPRPTPGPASLMSLRGSCCPLAVPAARRWGVPSCASCPAHGPTPHLRPSAMSLALIPFSLSKWLSSPSFPALLCPCRHRAFHFVYYWLYLGNIPTHSVNFPFHLSYQVSCGRLLTINPYFLVNAWRIW